MSGAWFWLPVTALVLVAFLIKRRQGRRRLESWSEQEDGGERYH
jgi:hypothetical protein